MKRVFVQGLGFVGSAMATAIAIPKDNKGDPLYFVTGVDLPNKVGRQRITKWSMKKFTRYDFAKTIQQLMYDNKSEIIKVNPDNSFLHKDLSLTQSKLCSSFQRFTSLEYIQRE